MKAELEWRAIFDCKIPGSNISRTVKQAEEAGYKYFCHNGRLFSTKDQEQVDCIKIIQD